MQSALAILSLKMRLLVSVITDLTWDGDIAFRYVAFGIIDIISAAINRDSQPQLGRYGYNVNQTRDQDSNRAGS